MSYQFEIDVSTNVNAETVQKIVANIVEERTGKQVDKILTKTVDGQFEGYEIHFISETTDTTLSKKERIIDKTFKVFKWE